MSSTGDSMTNEEYQRQAREKQRLADQERFRQGIEAANQQQRAQTAKREAAARAAHSKRMGEMGAIPIGGIDFVPYMRGLQEHNRREAEKKKNAPKAFSGGHTPTRNTNYSAPAPPPFSHTENYSAPTHGGSSGYSVDYERSNRGRNIGGSIKRGFFGIVAVVFIIFVIGIIGKIMGDSKPSGNETAPQPQTIAPANPSAVTTETPPKPSAGQLETSPQETKASDAQPDTTLNTPPLTNAPPLTSENSIGAETAALSAGTSSPAWPVTGERFLANHKGTRHGCKHGVLALYPAGLQFFCLSDPSKNVVVNIAQIKRIDNDGIEAYPHDLYHFKVGDDSEEKTHQLFARWLDAVRVKPSTGN